MGGKFRTCKAISKYINSRLNPLQVYWEPFVGGAWVTQYIDPARKRFASDSHPDLIAMWVALQQGWIPPDIVTEQQYFELKNSHEISAMRGFAGFGCSFAGKFFGGYARSNRKDYAKCAKNSLQRKMLCLGEVNFACGPYDSFKKVTGALVYCDPPYQGTTKFSTGQFDSEKFWGWVRATSENNTVLVSEYSAPSDFFPVLSIETKTDLRTKVNGKEPRIEKVFEIRRIY